MRKSREGTSHPDRNAQFEHLNAKADDFLQRGQPVVSVDTKKKELVGDFKNDGREWQPKGQPEHALVHDFAQDAVGKAIPYGIYDMARNEAWVSVGRDHDTPAFAVASLRQWWQEMGRHRYPAARELLTTAAAAGSNGYRARLETRLAAVCGRHGYAHSRQPFAAWHEQVEQDRAPSVLPHYTQLAGQGAADL